MSARGADEPLCSKCLCLERPTGRRVFGGQARAMPLLLHHVGELVCEQATRAVTCERCGSGNMHCALSRECVCLDRRRMRIDMSPALETHALRRGACDCCNGCAHVGGHGV